MCRGQRPLPWYIASLSTLQLITDISSNPECRIDFLREFYASATGLLDLDHRVWVQLFQSALKRAQAASTPEKPFWGAKIIYSTIRFIDAGSEKGQLRWFMEDCIALKKEFPDLIIGMARALLPHRLLDCSLRWIVQDSIS